MNNSTPVVLVLALVTAVHPVEQLVFEFEDRVPCELPAALHVACFTFQTAGFSGQEVDQVQRATALVLCLAILTGRNVADRRIRDYIRA